MRARRRTQKDGRGLEGKRGLKGALEKMRGLKGALEEKRGLKGALDKKRGLKGSLERGGARRRPKNEDRRLEGAIKEGEKTQIFQLA